MKTEEERKSKKRIYMKDYHQRPEVKARENERMKEYYKRPEVKARVKEYRERPEVKANRKEYLEEYNSNPEKKAMIKERMKEYHSRPEVKEMVRINKIKYRNTQKSKENEKEYRSRPGVKIKLHANSIKYLKTQKRKDYMKKYCNTIEFKTKKNNRNKTKYNNDNIYRTRNLLRKRLYQALKNYTVNGKVWESKTYGVDYQAIIEHLKPFPENISKYHIDHIRPLCSFDLEDPEQVKQAFAPENHQWLLAFDNISKGGKYLP